jgi:hypothetical protein
MIVIKNLNFSAVSVYTILIPPLSYITFFYVSIFIRVNDLPVITSYTMDDFFRMDFSND